MPDDKTPQGGASDGMTDLAERKARLTQAKRALLAKRLSGRTSAATAPEAIPRLDRGGPLPASFAQERLWFLDRFQRGNPFFNVSVTAKLEGFLDRGVLTRCLDEIVRRHETLRTSMVFRDGVLAQAIAAPFAVTLDREDLQFLPESDREAEAVRRCEALVRVSFDLGEGPLFRARLFQLEDELHIFVLTLHHIVCDGWSLPVLLGEIALLYNAYANDEPSPLAPLAVQYGDFAAWQRTSLAGETLEEHVNFWQRELAGAPAVIDLPTDRTRPLNQTYRGDLRSIELSPQLASLLDDFSSRQATTPFVVLLSALAATLSHWSSQSDMVIGTVVAGRPRPELERLIGCFINFLPIRVVVPESSAHALVRAVSAACVAAYEHQACPFEKIVEIANPDRTRNQNPIFNVGIVLQNYPQNAAFSGTLKAEVVPLKFDTSTLDLRFVVEPRASGVTVICEYNTDLFDSETAVLLLQAFAACLETMLAAPETPVASLRIPDALAERADRVRARARAYPLAIASSFTPEPLDAPLSFWTRELGLSAPVTFAPPNALLQQLLDPRSVIRRNRSGANVMLVRFEDWAGIEVAAQALSESLDRAIDEFLSALEAAGANRLPLIVVICPPSQHVTPEARAALLDAETKLLRMLEDVAGVHAAGTADLALYEVGETGSGAYAEAVAGIPYSHELYTAIATVIARRIYALRSPPRKAIVLDCDNTLWKGVCGEEDVQSLELGADHAALQRRLLAEHDAGMLVCLASKNNDDDVWQVFESRQDFPLRRAHFAASRINWQPKSANLKALARELNIGLDSFVFIDDDPREVAEVAASCPQVLALALPQDGTPWEDYLRHVWALDHLTTTNEAARRTELYRQEGERRRAAGEAPSFEAFLASLELEIDIAPIVAADVDRVAELTYRTTQFNLSSVRRTAAEIRAIAEDERVRCLTIRVEDRFGAYGLTGVVIYSLRPPALVLDTFLLSCRVLGRGVEHRVFARMAALAEEAGCSHIEAPYRKTARSTPVFEFLESLRCERKAPVADGTLFRFSVADAAEAPAAVAPPVAISDELPGDAIEGAADDALLWPGEAATLARIATELNSAARIRAAMERQSTIAVSARAFEPPRTPLEREVATVWGDVLGLERVGVHDNFFEVGGHSLRAIAFIEKIKDLFNVEIPIVDFFHAPTVADCAAWLANAPEVSARARSDHSTRDAPAQTGAGKLSTTAETRHPALFALQRAGDRTPFFCIHPLHGHVICYGQLARSLGRDRPFYGLQSIGLDGRHPALESVEQMGAEYAAAIRSVQPEGPYLIGGYSLGTAIALETARILRAQGQEIALLVSFDDATFNDDLDNSDDDLWFILGLFQEKFIQFEGLTELLPHFYLGLASFLDEYASLDSKGQLALVASEAIATGVLPQNIRMERAMNLLNVMRSNVRALMRYSPCAYDGKITVLKAGDQPWYFLPSGWGNLEGATFDVRRVPGSHFTLLNEPFVGPLASALKRCIDEADPSRAQRGIAYPFR